MTIGTDKDLRELRNVGRAVAVTLNEMMAQAEPGMTTRELDLIGKSLLGSFGAKSAPKLTYKFPGYTCISINEEAAHGIPGDRIINPGDVVNIDVSAEKNGYFADTGGTFIIPPSDLIKRKLIKSAKMALREACYRAKAGSPLNEIGRAVQKVAKRKGFKIIENLCSHGIGRGLHEEPKVIPSYFDPRDKRRLHKGLVITIEPFLSTVSSFVNEGCNGWTLVGCKDNLSAQFEHTMVITEGKPILLTVA